MISVPKRPPSPVAKAVQMLMPRHSQCQTVALGAAVCRLSQEENHMPSLQRTHEDSSGYRVSLRPESPAITRPKRSTETQTPFFTSACRCALSDQIKVTDRGGKAG